MCIEGKELYDLFHEFVERHIAVELALPLVDFFEHLGVLLRRTVGFDVGTRHSVVGMQDQSERVHDGLHRGRGFQQKSLVRHELDGVVPEVFVVGERLEEGQNLLGFGFYADEDGHFVIGHPRLAHTDDLFSQLVLHFLFFDCGQFFLTPGFALRCGLGQDMNAHETAGIVLLLRHFALVIEFGEELCFI